MIAGEALYHAYFDKEKQYLLISAMHCEQSVLGIIGDMAIKVDVAKVSIAYTDIDSGYQVSIRSADREYLANEVAEKLCNGIGSGGGHIDKAGGVISRDCICEQLCRMGNCRHYQRENGKNHEIKKETVVYKKGSKPLFLSIMMLEFPVLIEFYR